MASGDRKNLCIQKPVERKSVCVFFPFNLSFSRAIHVMFYVNNIYGVPTVLQELNTDIKDDTLP